MNAINQLNYKSKSISVYDALEKQSGGLAAYQAGSVIQVTMTSKTDLKAVLTTKDGISFEADAANIRGEVGDELFFEILKNDKDGIQLRQLQNDAQKLNREMRRQNAQQDVKELFKQSNFIKEYDKQDPAGEQIKEQINASRAISKIKRRLLYGAEVDENAVRELLASGVSLDKIDFGMLTAVMREIAPAVERDRSEAEAALEKFRDVKKLDNAQIIDLIREGTELTLENVYIARHSGHSSTEPVTAMDDSLFDALAPEMEKVFEREGIELSEDTMDIAKLFVERDIPITKENIEKFIFLQKLGERVDEGDLLAVVRGNIAGEKNAADVDLSEIENITSKRRLAETQLKMTYEASYRLRSVEIDTEPLRETVDRLRAEERRYEISLRLVGADTENIGDMNELYSKLSDIKPVSAAGLWASYSEMRASSAVFGDVLQGRERFTIESVHSSYTGRLREDYETFATVPGAKYGDSFADVRGKFPELLESLSIEPDDENVKAAIILSRNAMDVTEENIMQVRLLSLKISDVMNRLHPTIAASVLKDGLNPLKMHIDELIAYIDSFENVYGTDLEDKLAEYIAEMDVDTQLDRDERDSLTAIYRMLNAIRGNGGAALRAALDGELTLGGMMDAGKNFRRTKSRGTDYKIDDSFGALEHLNVPSGNIREILERAYEREAARFTPEEKQRNDGLLERNMMGQTAENLGRIAEIDGTPELELNDDTLLETAYMDILSQIFTRHASPGKLRGLMRDHADYKDIPLDRLVEEMRDTVENSPNDEELRAGLEKLEAVYQASAQTLHWMESVHIPTTPTFIGIVRQMHKNPYFMTDELDELEKKLAEDSEKPEYNALEELIGGESVEEALDSYYEGLHDRLQESKVEQDDSSLIKHFTLVQNAIKVRNWVQKSSGEKEIHVPVALHDKIAGLNMYVLNESFSGDGTLLMSLNTNALGNVQIYIEANGRNAAFRVVTDSEDGLAHLRMNSETLRRFAEEAGYGVEQMIFSSPENL